MVLCAARMVWWKHLSVRVRTCANGDEGCASGGTTRVQDLHAHIEHRHVYDGAIIVSSAGSGMESAGSTRKEHSAHSCVPDDVCAGHEPHRSAATMQHTRLS